MAKGYRVPKVKQDLEDFWGKAEDGLRSLGLEPEGMCRRHISKVGSYLLGDGAWKVLRGKPFDDWEEFKLQTGKRYGLTSRQVHGAFFSMVKGEGESEEEFIVRVEDWRLAHGYSSDECFRNFVQKLSPQYLQQLTLIQRLKYQNEGTTELEWEDLVADAEGR